MKAKARGRPEGGQAKDRCTHYVARRDHGRRSPTPPRRRRLFLLHGDLMTAGAKIPMG